MSIGENIARRREQLGLTQDQLAERMGYRHKSSISKIEKGVNDISQSKIRQFAEALHTTVDYILDGEPGEPIITCEYVNFPIIGEIAAGYERFADQDEYGSIDIPLAWLRGRPQEDYFVLRVTGDSMFPLYHDGDLVLVLKQSTMNYSGQVGVVLYDDTKATLKRVEYVYGEDWMRLCPINPNYPPIIIIDERLEHCRVLGIPKMLIREITS